MTSDPKPSPLFDPHLLWLIEQLTKTELRVVKAAKQEGERLIFEPYEEDTPPELQKL